MNTDHLNARIERNQREARTGDYSRGKQRLLDVSAEYLKPVVERVSNQDRNQAAARSALDSIREGLK